MGQRFQLCCLQHTLLSLSLWLFPLSTCRYLIRNILGGSFAAQVSCLLLCAKVFHGCWSFKHLHPGIPLMHTALLGSSFSQKPARKKTETLPSCIVYASTASTTGMALPNLAFSFEWSLALWNHISSSAFILLFSGSRKHLQLSFESWTLTYVMSLALRSPFPSF